MSVDLSKYTLVLEDNFNKGCLDESIWSLCPEQRRQDAGGKWDNSMTSFDDSHLILSAGLNKDGVPISGAIRTKGKFEQAYGYFECRLKFQKTTGFWGAFWLMCDAMPRHIDGSAVTGAEIDIIESGEFPRNGVNHAIHWDGYGAEHKSESKILNDMNLYDGEFHTYALEWTKDYYIFYIDGKETWKTNEMGICEVPVYVKLSTEFGTWAGEIKPETLPDCMVVDYVKVYKLN